MPEPSEVHAALPPPVGYWTRGIVSPSSLPVSTSKKCNVPCSLPPSEREMATRRPSGDGTDQSIAMLPFVLYAFGSKTVRQSAGGFSEERRTRTGCCAGGLKRTAKIL